MNAAAPLLALAFPDLDPVAVRLGPFAIRWYALAYVAGLVLGWLYIRRLAAAEPRALTVQQADDVLLWVTLGVVLGGRLGYVLFYKPGFFLDNPLEIVKLWRGGMSFHGGLLGVTAALYLFARHHGVKVLAVSDLVACAVPIGLFFGRLANFVNAELWGRPTDVPWAVVFPHPLAGGVPRHPSQLYEATLEGIVLFAVLWVLFHRTRARTRTGELTGFFCMGYAIARIFVEFFRQPDPQLGFLLGGVTMGQLLSLPLLAFGVFLVVRARRQAAP